MTKNEMGDGSLVESFLTMLRAQPSDDVCEWCLTQLDAYVTAQFEGDDYRSQYPEVAQHLDSCVSCAESYERVYELILAEQNGRLLQPDHIPKPDLGFLTPSANLWAKLQAALQMTQTQITLQLDAVLASLLIPPPTPAFTRSGDDGRFGQKLLSLTAEQTPDTELPFSLNVYADKENQEFCLVEITVEPPGLSWPDLGGSDVAILYGAETVTAVTDDWGTAVFMDIPRSELENLRFEITLHIS